MEYTRILIAATIADLRCCHGRIIITYYKEPEWDLENKNVVKVGIGLAT